MYYSRFWSAEIRFPVAKVPETDFETWAIMKLECDGD